MKKNLGRRGMVWEAGKVATLLSAVLFFTIILSMHLRYSDIRVLESAKDAAKSVAGVVDSVGSSSDYAETAYPTPASVGGRNYSITFSGGVVFVSAESAPNASASSLSQTPGAVCVGGSVLRLNGSRGIVEVSCG